MKVGTLSLNINAPDFNYGAMLHSWAMQQYLLAHDDIETEIIDYTTPKVEGWNRKNPRLSSLNYQGAHSYGGSKKYYISRLEKFDSFISSELIVSTHKYTQKSLAKAELDYDVIICESDVIWLPRRGFFDPNFFLAVKSMSDKRRIAYAPSMADAPLTEEQKTYLNELLLPIHFISCRESYLKEMLEKHTDKEIKHVLDPVFLVTPEEYDRITAPRLISEDYLLLYLPVDNNMNLRKNAFDYAEKEHLKVLEISTKLKVEKDDMVSIPDAGVEEFLSAIRYANVIFTNSFHAICFSIIFKKQFYAFSRKMSGKVKDICSTFGLLNYYFDDKDFSVLPPIDFSEVEKRTNTYRKESIEWLENALYGEKETTEDFDYSLVDKHFDDYSLMRQAKRRLVKEIEKKKRK